MLATATTEWLTAIGTVGAVVVALGFPLGRCTVQRWRRPRLAIDVGPSPPLVATEGQGQEEATVVRAKVTNAGRTEAKRVRVQVGTCWFKSDVPTATVKPWSVLVTLPVPLRWESRPASSTGQAAEEVDLATAVSDYVTLTETLTAQPRRHRLPSVDGSGPDLDPENDVGEYRFFVTAYAENAEPVSVVVGYRRESDLRQAPEPHKTYMPGKGEIEGG